MRRLSSFFIILLGGLLFIGANGCSSNPNVEGAKLDLRNKDYDRALENVNTALEENPKNAEALKLKGDILVEKATTVDAQQRADLIERGVAAYDKALEINPELEDEINKAKRLAYIKEFDAGAKAFKRGQEDESAYSEAATYFSNAAELQPDSAGAFVNRAYALMNAGEQQAAVEPLKTAIEKGADDAQNYTILGQLLMQQNEGGEGAQEAIAVLEEAQEKYPDDSDLQSLLLNAYVEAGQMERAMETYAEAVQREPENKLYRYNYGSLLLRDEQFDRAIEQLQRATEIDPNYADAHYNLGAAYVQKAIAANDSLSQLNERFREEQSELSEEEQQQMKEKMQELVDQRESLFAEAIPSLQKARELTQQEGGDTQSICRSLFQAYVQTGQEDKAEKVSSCAGWEDKDTNQ